MAKQIGVRIGVMPGRMYDVEVPEGSTILDCIKAAKIQNGESRELRLNAEPAELDQKVRSGDLICLARELRGN